MVHWYIPLKLDELNGTWVLEQVCLSALREVLLSVPFPFVITIHRT
jgi:hypothetical protein